VVEDFEAHVCVSRLNIHLIPERKGILLFHMNFKVSLIFAYWPAIYNLSRPN
jgi:hypothetical protein